MNFPLQSTQKSFHPTQHQKIHAPCWPAVVQSVSTIGKVPYYHTAGRENALTIESSEHWRDSSYQAYTNISIFITEALLYIKGEDEIIKKKKGIKYQLLVQLFRWTNANNDTAYQIWKTLYVLNKIIGFPRVFHW